jgi:NAD-dependent dihydropyrimidine dehydrogenase PreA subunit
MPEWHSDGNDVTIKIDHDKCTGCGECVDICPAEVYELVNEKSVAENVDECVECCACEDVCPDDALWLSCCG